MPRPLNELIFTPNNRTAELEINNIADLEYRVTDPSAVMLNMKTFERSNKGLLKLTVPQNITENFANINLVLWNKLTSQEEQIQLKFWKDKHDDEEEDAGSSKDTILYIFSRKNFLDLLTVLIILIIVALLSHQVFKHFVNI